MLFSVVFATITILSCFFLILGAIVQIFNPIAELVHSIGIPIKETKAENEIHPVIKKPKTRKCSI